MKRDIYFTLNNERFLHGVESNKTLLEMIKEDFDLNGRMKRCSSGKQEPYMVLINGETVDASLLLAVDIDCKEVTTIEEIFGCINAGGLY